MEHFLPSSTFHFQLSNFCIYMNVLLKHRKSNLLLFISLVRKCCNNYNGMLNTFVAFFVDFIDANLTFLSSVVVTSKNWNLQAESLIPFIWVSIVVNIQYARLHINFSITSKIKVKGAKTTHERNSRSRISRSINSHLYNDHNEVLITRTTVTAWNKTVGKTHDSNLISCEDGHQERNFFHDLISRRLCLVIRHCCLCARTRACTRERAPASTRTHVHIISYGEDTYVFRGRVDGTFKRAWLFLVHR